MRVLRVLLLVALWASSAVAQTGTDVFARARRLVNDGDAKAGRALVDSVLAAAPAGSAGYAEALFWRGVLAEGADAMRTDLLRVAIEFPLAPRASDALLRLAQMEFTRGDRVSAQRYLDRLSRDYPGSPLTAAGRYWAGRILFEDSKPVDACAALRDARRLAASGDVELVNQIDYYSRPCDAIAMDAKARADSLAAADSAKKAAEAQQAAAKGKWSVQVAAFGNRTDAVALAKRLTTRGFDARVTAEKPWRVRIGHYVTRAEAAGVAQQLSTPKSKALVVEAEGR